MNSRLGVYVSLKRDCAPGRCMLCVVYLCCIQTACVERELNGGGVKARLSSNYADTDFIITV